LKLTKAEAEAIIALEDLARRWPKSLKLFSWSGALHVMKPGAGRTNQEASMARIDIPNDGGDPGNDEECH
jgi:hypothetical protein